MFYARLYLSGCKDAKFAGVVVAMDSCEECTVPLDDGGFAPMVLSAYCTLPVNGAIGPSFSDVEGVSRVGHQLRLSSYRTLEDKLVSRFN